MLEFGEFCSKVSFLTSQPQQKTLLYMAAHLALASVPCGNATAPESDCYIQ